MFFSRVTKKISSVRIPFKIKSTETIHPYLVNPISEGLCQYSDIYNLALDDFVRMNEIIEIKQYNQNQADKHYQMKMKRDMGNGFCAKHLKNTSHSKLHGEVNLQCKMGQGLQD